MPAKVLIIDDDRDILDVLELILLPEGYEIIKDTGLNSLDDIENINPDILVIDDWLRQGMLGNIICKFVKQNPSTAHIRVILISAHNGLAAIAKMCMADGYLEKPFDIDVLLNLIRLQMKALAPKGITPGKQ